MPFGEAAASAISYTPYPSAVTLIRMGRM